MTGTTVPNDDSDPVAAARGRTRESAAPPSGAAGLQTVLRGAVAGVGGGLAIGIMEWFWLVTHFPLAAIPFATSIVLVIGGSEAKAAQPRALVGGHIVSTV